MNTWTETRHPRPNVRKLDYWEAWQREEGEDKGRAAHRHGAPVMCEAFQNGNIRPARSGGHRAGQGRAASCRPSHSSACRR